MVNISRKPTCHSFESFYYSDLFVEREAKKTLFPPGKCTNSIITNIHKGTYALRCSLSPGTCVLFAILCSGVKPQKCPIGHFPGSSCDSYVD